MKMLAILLATSLVVAGCAAQTPQRAAAPLTNEREAAPPSEPAAAPLAGTAAAAPRASDSAAALASDRAAAPPAVERAPVPSKDYGVLVMAHGGSADWDEAVLESVAPLREDYAVEVAFGMADAASLQAGIEKLEARGVREIGVVRLFVSADSFLDRTEQILGLRAGAPPKPAHAGHTTEHGGHGMELWKVDTRSTFALSMEGLNEAPEMGNVLVDRARALSRDPRNETVLVLAHGPGDDEENARWLAYMDRQAELIRNELPFAEVAVATLREDWPEKRAAAEALARDFVRRSRDQGRTPIVVPFRVHGFGPYSDVLEGLDYVADEQGLLPHPAVTRWIERQARTLLTTMTAEGG